MLGRGIGNQGAGATACVLNGRRAAFSGVRWYFA
jgi:hypothetical protein